MSTDMTELNTDLSLYVAAPDGKMRGFDKTGSTPLDVRAFPNAEGIAALTRGAAGHVGTKTLAFVDNLNDTGAGSLRDALEGSGNEGTFVIFRTSGTINLTDVLFANSHDITLAFQTSPSGIAIVGAPIRISGDDYIMRHGRFRCGSHQPIDETNQESLSIFNADNIMIANSSFTWGGDETIGCTSFGGTPFTRITFMDVIIGEGLTDVAPESNHGYGILLNGNYAAGNTVDFIRPLFTSSNARLPQWSGDVTSTIVNSVVYNFDGAQSSMLDMQGGSPQVNSLSCMTKAGIDSNASIRYGSGGTNTAAEYLALGTGPQNTVTTTPYPALYMRDAFGTDRLLDADAEWSIADGFSGAYLPITFEALTPFVLSGGLPITEIVTTEANYETVRDQVVSGVGATIPVRDSADTNIVDNYFNGSGTLVADVAYPADYPTYGSASYPPDTDGDGIPDSYWTYRALSAQTWDAVAPSGYLWIEEFINDLADGKYSYA